MWKTLALGHVTYVVGAVFNLIYSQAQSILGYDDGMNEATSTTSHLKVKIYLSYGEITRWHKAAKP